MTTEVTLRAPAKLNLFLRVLAREDDGYHGIESLFCLIDLADELKAERREGRGVSLTVGGADCGPEEMNLATRAARMVLDATGNPCAVHLTLTKRIPIQAGLGGGSSDAAAALTAVNQLVNNAVPRHELLQFAARLGSDVPFFLSGGSLALCWGHGERMLRLPPLPASPGLLLIPPIGISTPEAYRQVDAGRHGSAKRGAVAMDLDTLGGWGNVARLGGNDFEFALFGRHPELKQGFEALAATHPLLCRMTGSGSGLFAIYRNTRDREDARMQLSPRLGRALTFETQ
ncbi:MAG TPA: 4-(cytidine 5'-diphospho)-2-C-methyl-D-erythritol kinase [Gemmatimonadales bacterium]|nr:4-(cytidine 5'-diphospho)-2-C-methyl-D-erythritol kinase [Gemmatimonadales bacterium]